MYKKHFLLCLIILPAILGCSAFYFQTPYSRFNHEKHVDALYQQNKDCFYCHKLPEPEPGQPQTEPKVLPDLKLDAKCHSCHRDHDTKIAGAPKNCNLCHDNMKVLKPADHVTNWKNLHSVPASLDSKSCSNCHSQWYCQSCHTREKTSETLRHTRAFKLKHSMEAMIDPGSCDACHRVDFCLNCHRKGK